MSRSLCCFIYGCELTPSVASAYGLVEYRALIVSELIVSLVGWHVHASSGVVWFGVCYGAAGPVPSDSKARLRDLPTLNDEERDAVHARFNRLPSAVQRALGSPRHLTLWFEDSADV